MLALSRKRGQKLMIGDNIILTVVEIKGDQVKLALEAPKEVKIFRGEIYEAIVEENLRAVVAVDDMGLLKGIRKNPKE